MNGNQSGQLLDHARRSYRTRYINGQAFVGKLINDGQALQYLSVGASIEHKVIRPHTIG